MFVRALKIACEWVGQGRWRRVVLAGLGLWAGGVALLWVAVGLTALPGGLEQETEPSVIFLGREGVPLRLTRRNGGRFHLPVLLKDCPDTFIQATLAAEDKRFWSHGGVDWIGTVRALKDWVVQGRVVSGASTITQQLIKQVDPRPRTLGTKALECLRAMKLERAWGKSEILERYLNSIDYGNLCQGAGVAAWFYFGKPLADLSIAEAAYLAGLPNAPSRLNPRRHPERAKARQELILWRMRRVGWLDNASLKRAQEEPIILSREKRPFLAPHFTEFLNARKEHEGIVRTTLDVRLNQIVGRVLDERLRGLEGKNVTQGAVVVIENATGGVLAMVGSRDFFGKRAGQVNGAWAPRSAGSTFKPFTYLLGLEAGLSSATVVADVPTRFATSTGVFEPHNYNRRYRGPVRLREALANSLNVTAVKVLKKAGGAEVLRERLEACGLDTLKEKAGHYGLGLTIGNADARLLELANAYACLARLGIWKPYTLERGVAVERKRVFREREAWLVADFLNDNGARAMVFGVDGPLKFDFPVACKTGTSSDFRDNWAFGYTPEFTVGVWVGNFDGTPMVDVSGVEGAAPVMHEVMDYLRKHFGASWFERPKGLVEARVHPLTGKLSDLGVREWFLEDNLPGRSEEVDFDADGRVRLGTEYAEWMDGPDNWLGDGIVLSNSEEKGFQIMAPLPGTVFYLDPNLPETSSRIRLRASCSSGRWSSSTLDCVETEGGIFAELKPGRHWLRVEAGGQRLKTWIEVKAL